ncbi:membrane lipoprotein lipid attachment site-containing protein [Citrobacter portucalensis]|uniref:membrane lipoprotein lipid attachment site-containing protein n=1 Tax=Citrobacter portucalensis TaxID=1639133 RepID=UPI00202CF10B|nr:membrane lipoprotein lipid attachment site-containing protein [Citrobacter portucalensis]URR11172.1 membrane lipoprotein lipid attachment site-containing protein [Citrobacter portucalensis]
MKKTITFIALTALLSGCSADFAQRYADAKREQDRKEHHHRHHDRQNDDYTSSDGYRMITKQGVTLPDCEELPDASQADNGGRCWYR